VAAGEHIHRAVVVARAEHVIEVDPAIEKSPGDIAHQRTQKVADVHGVAALRPADVREILVAPELELAKLEIAITEYRMQLAGLRLDVLLWSVHSFSSNH